MLGTGFKNHIFGCLFLIIPLIGTVRRPVPPPRTKFHAVFSDISARETLLKQLELPRKPFESGDFHQAAALFQRGRQDAVWVGEVRIATRFLNNLKTCRFALHQFQEALRAFLGARGLAVAACDMQSVGALDFNISSLYSQLGQLDTLQHFQMDLLRSYWGAYFVTGDQP